MIERIFTCWSRWVSGHRGLTITALVLFTLVCLAASLASQVDNSLAVWQSEQDAHWQHYQQFQEDNQISDPLVLYLPAIARQQYPALRDRLTETCECAVSGFLLEDRTGTDQGLLLVKPPPDSPPKDLDALVDLTKRILDETSVPYHLGGVWYVTAMLDIYSATSVSLLFPVVLAVLWLGVWYLLRHTGNVTLVMGCGLAPAIQIVGLMAMSGVRLNMILLALPPLTMILGTAYAIHLAAKAAAPETGDRHYLFALIATPCLLSALTTSLGFLSLTISAYNPVRQLGTWGAIAAALALLNTFILLPAFYRPGSIGPPIHFSPRSAELLQRHRLPMLGLFAAALVMAVFGLIRLKTGSVILDFFYPSAEVHRNYEAIESAGIGLTPFEIDLEGYDKDNDTLNQALLSWAQTEPLVTHFIFFFPAGQVFIQTVGEGLQLPTPSQLQYITSPAKRVTVLLKTVSSEKTLQLAEQLNRHLEKNLGRLASPYITGSVPLYTRGQQALFSSMASSFSFAFISVSLVIGIALKSWRYGAIAILPNVLPVALILAAMGWAGISLSVSTITVASIVFGIVVDDTIHFLHRLRVAEGALNQRLQSSLESVGPAIIITSLVSGLGFAGFAASPFIPLRDFGLIISAALFLALFCDLLLLPALLFVWRFDQ